MKLKRWVKITLLIVAEILTLILASIEIKSGVTPLMKTISLIVILISENLLFFFQD